MPATSRRTLHTHTILKDKRKTANSYTHQDVSYGLHFKVYLDFIRLHCRFQLAIVQGASYTICLNHTTHFSIFLVLVSGVLTGSRRIRLIMTPLIVSG